MAQVAAFDEQRITGAATSRGPRVVALEGDLRLTDASALWKQVAGAVDEVSDEGLRIDLARVTSCDAGVLALLLALRDRGARRGVTVELTGADERVRALVDLHEDAGAPDARRRRAEGFVAHAGRATVEILGELREIVAFLGRIVSSAAAVARRPGTGNWRDVLPVVERAGADALPIVLLINALVGFVMAFQSARQLAAYGANIYVADLVGLSMTRELAPLMTAIILAGRSGAAFAAELGTMKVSEEIDALRTMGFGAVRHLVLPRVLGLVIVAPMLTLLSDVVGVLGGMAVASSTLGVSPTAYFNQTLRAVHAWDVESGILKSVVFGATIALIACQQGFATSGGAAGVGRRTTSTVVSSLFAIVLLDALFTFAFRWLDA